MIVTYTNNPSSYSTKVFVIEPDIKQIEITPEETISKTTINEIQSLVFQVQESKSKYVVDLKERTFKFAVDVLLLIRTVTNNKENDVIKYQLSKAGTSVGANYEESQATNSRADFRHKIGISLKEIREANYWLRIMESIKIGEQEEVKRLIKESSELKLILGSIYNKVSDKS